MEKKSLNILPNIFIEGVQFWKIRISGCIFQLFFYESSLRVFIFKFYYLIYLCYPQRFPVYSEV